MVIRKGGGGLLRRKNLQISDLQRLASLHIAQVLRNNHEVPLVARILLDISWAFDGRFYPESELI